MCDVSEEACFSKIKMFKNGLNISLSQWAWLKDSHRVETNWFSGKEKAPHVAVSEEDYVDSVLEHE